MRTIRSALLGTALAAVALPALAQPTPPPPGGPPGMFARIDANGDGRITQEEGWSFVQARFAEADRNKDGALALEEATSARLMPPPPAAGAPPAPPPREMGPMQARIVAMMFRAADANRDGRVTLDEVRPLAEARFRAIDANGDNGITMDELPLRPHHHHRGPHHGAHGDRPEAPPPAR
ncbi:EF-hand domain-containing protein [Belnapia sp. T18]|uniref:EF-hand domain-containing protein n=1 Tax=Belnapia arida TaxID=2804533 RepID=A0ABS1UCM3_9PROT|nr:EF-hand domain-containing protein [Belnapia arida]MBL6081442.1 EF-hand domain-containing protein [Belnapia arida]